MIDHWDVVRFVKLYARCRTPDVDEQSRIERQLLTLGLPYPFQEMITTIRTYHESDSGAVDQWAINHPHQRALIAKLRQTLNDMQVLGVLRTLEDTNEGREPGHQPGTEAR